MLLYLDSLILIYLPDHTGSFQARAARRISAAARAGDLFAIGDLTRFECRVGPIRARDAQRLVDFEGFFLQPDVRLVQLPGAVYDLAAEIRADHGFTSADSIHLAAAVHARCDAFLTNDLRLQRFTGISIGILP